MAPDPPLQDPDEEGRKDRLQAEADPEAPDALRRRLVSDTGAQGPSRGGIDVLPAVPPGRHALHAELHDGHPRAPPGFAAEALPDHQNRLRIVPRIDPPG